MNTPRFSLSIACLASSIALICGTVLPAAASDMSMSIGSTTWNGNMFSVSVTVTNNAPSGSGAVNVSVSGPSNTSGLNVTGGQDGGGGSQIPGGGGTDTFSANGTLTSGTSATITVEIEYVNSRGDVVTKTQEVTVTKPTATATPRQAQPHEGVNH